MKMPENNFNSADVPQFLQDHPEANAAQLPDTRKKGA
jgi:hypothetical protein